MRAQSRRTIALLVDSLSSDYAALLQHAIKRAANASDVSVMTFAGLRLNDAEVFESTQNRIYDYVTPARVDGVIIVSALLAHYSGVRGIKELCGKCAPLPLCSVGLQIEDVPSVVVDNSGGMERGIDHLLQAHKVRRIAFIAAQPNSPESNERLSGYKKALERHGIEFDERLVEHGDFTVPGGAAALRRLIAKGVHFDAVAAANDYMALASMDVLSEHSLRIPNDIPVLGFDDVSNALCSKPTLTTLRQPMWWLATKAVELVLRQMAGKAVSALHTGEIELVRRDSCGCGLAPKSVSSPMNFAPRSLSEFFAQERASLERAMFQSVLVPNNALGDWTQGLFDNLVQELTGCSGQFAAALDSVLDRAGAAGANLDEFQRMITVLRDELRRAGIDRHLPTQLTEDCWHTSRLVVASAALREAGQQRNSMQHSTAALGRSGEHFATAMSLPLIKRAIAEQLPVFNIEQASVALFSEESTKDLVPLLVTRKNEVLAVAEGPLSAHHLAPSDFFENDKCLNFVVLPLTFEGQFIGIALLADCAHPIVYGVLRHQIGSAIQIAALHRRMVTQVETRERLDQLRLREESRVATDIQTTMAPSSHGTAHYNLAHVSIPAAEAGGDYYDVIDGTNAVWLTMGDVTGHGLGAGLIMLMLQSVIAGLVRSDPATAPRHVVAVANEVIYDNVRHRLKRDDHATLTALRCHPDGTIEHAGAHEPIVVYRAAAGKCEIIETAGIWVGVLENATNMFEQLSFKLNDGDILMLHTDGLTEARSAHSEHFGLQRLADALAAACELPVEDIRDRVIRAVQAWSTTQDDDVTLLIARYSAHASVPLSSGSA